VKPRPAAQVLALLAAGCGQRPTDDVRLRLDAQVRRCGVNRRQGLAATLGLLALPAAAAADAPLVRQTELIDELWADAVDLAPGGPGVVGKPFVPRREGALWLMFDIVARREPQGRGELVLDTPLLNVAMSADQALVRVKDSQLVRPLAEHWPRDDKGQLRAPSGRPLDARVQAALSAALTAGQARRLVVIHRVDLKRPEETQARVVVSRQDGLVPLLVEVQVGQGPVPREHQAFADGVNGPWLQRHAYEMAMIGSGVLVGALAIWRLRR